LEVIKNTPIFVLSITTKKTTTMNIKCPICNHTSDLDSFFEWGSDCAGHPTVDILTCPSCLASNHPYRGDMPMRNEKGRFIKYPERVDFDDFIEVD
jgi:hypothetical protein